MPANEVIKINAGKLGKNLDVRGEGGYIVIAPSTHITATTIPGVLDMDRKISK